MMCLRLPCYALPSMLHFRRITTQTRFIPQIDGLRFVAIASVIFFHIYEALGQGAVPLPFSVDSDLPKRGVELFFAISGFILGVPFASQYLLEAPRVKLKPYFLRRLTRLEPPYFLALFASAVVQYFVAHRSFAEMAPHLIAHSFYVQNLAFGAFVRPVNSVAWSLEVEIQFYLLVPLLALLFSIRNTVTRRTVIVLTMLVTSLLNISLYRSTHFHYSILYYCPFFLAGFLLCDLYLLRGEWQKSFVWDVLGFCLWPFVWLMDRNFDHVVLPLLIIVLYLAAFRGRILSTILSSRVITAIGGMCYSLYLFHSIVISAVKHITAPLHFGQNFWLYFILQSCLIVPFVLLFCGTFFVLVERPCMDKEWPRKLRDHVRMLLPSRSEQQRV
jgi:peptidoglycan/LPS O-acetylase OafA/YrhL